MMNRCTIYYGSESNKYGTRYYIKNKWRDELGYSPDIEYCCVELNHFFSDHSDISIDLKNDRELEMDFVSSLGWYGENDKSSVTIRFCPFCGAKIELTNK